MPFGAGVGVGHSTFSLRNPFCDESLLPILAAKPCGPSWSQYR